jgi:hypothetical protein
MILYQDTFVPVIRFDMQSISLLIHVFLVVCQPCPFCSFHR